MTHRWCIAATAARVGFVVKSPGECSAGIPMAPSLSVEASEVEASMEVAK